MDLGLNGRRVLVCGASRGLGAATAQAFADEGAALVLAARGSDRLGAQSVRTKGHPIEVDLSAPEGPRSAVESAVEHLGGLDVLVVNSGGPPPGDFKSLTDEDWNRAIEGTLMSSIRLIRAGLPHLEKGIDPAIVIVLSSSVRMPIPGLTTSNVLRPGLAGLVKSLASELSPIRVNGVAPGRISTERVAAMDEQRAKIAGVNTEQIRTATEHRIPLGRYGDPMELGRVATLLASSAMSYVNGAIIQVDGGLVLALP
jgi:3-oxoacyl-[acyl-carrier protein] reductase